MKIQFTQEKRGEIERIQREFNNKLSSNEILRYTSMAINGVLKRARNRVKKQVSKEYNITQKYMDRLSKVKPYSNPASLWGGINLDVNRLPLIAFNPKQRGSLIYYSIHKGKPKYMRNSFIATVPARNKQKEIVNTHTGVFSRGHYGKKAGFIAGRELTDTGKVRITQIMGVSAFGMGTYKSVAQDVQQFMGNEVLARVEGILRSRVDKIVSQNKL